MTTSQKEARSPHRLTGTTRIAAWSARHPLKAILVWLLMIVAGFSLSFEFSPRQATDAELTTGQTRTAIQMTQAAGIVDPAVENVLITARSGILDRKAATDAATDALHQMEQLAEVKLTRGPFSSADGKAVLVQAVMSGDSETASDRVGTLLNVTADVQRAFPGLQVEQVGEASIHADFLNWLNQDVEKATTLSLPVTLIILLVAFGAIVMAGIPVVLAFASVLSAIGMWAAVSHLVPDQGMVTHLIVLVGMAVGVDYSLFYMRRFREERHAGVDKVDAVTIAAKTAGHSVIVSGTAVTISLAGLLLVRDGFFSGMAIGAIIVVLVAMVSSLTVLPALLVAFGRWVDRPRVPLIWRLNSRREPRVMPVLLRPVIRHPWIALAGAVIVLGALIAPLAGMSLKSTQISDYPRTLSTMQRYDRLNARFPDNTSSDRVVVHSPDASRSTLENTATSIARLTAQRPDLFGAVDEPRISSDGDTLVVDISVPHLVDSAKAQDSVRDLRERVVPEALRGVFDATSAVGGEIAANLDYTTNLNKKLPLVVGIVAGLTFMFMLVVYRSLAIAVVTIALNIASTMAAFGVLTLVFQNHWAEGLLAFTSNGHVVSWVPILLFVILSGLSLDYHVFVVSRVRENFVSGMSSRGAIYDGLVRTGGVVTSAALVMVAVFAIFGSLSFLELKQIGVGLSVAILLDATLIRVVALPAVLVLLRRVLWWPGIRTGRSLHSLKARPRRALATSSVALTAAPRRALQDSEAGLPTGVDARMRAGSSASGTGRQPAYVDKQSEAGSSVWSADPKAAADVDEMRPTDASAESRGRWSRRSQRHVSHEYEDGHVQLGSPERGSTAMTNPFDDESARIHVLMNPRGEYSLWPTFAAVPAGWTVVLNDASHPDACEYIEHHWTTLRPEYYVDTASAVSS